MTDEPIRLTDQQKQILEMLAEGLTDAQIARRTGRAESTARTNVRYLLRKKLGAGSRTEAVAIAYEKGLLMTSTAKENQRLRALVHGLRERVDELQGKLLVAQDELAQREVRR